MQRVATTLQLILFGQNVSLELFPRGTLFNPVGAVYVFTREIDQHTHRVIYVGQTGDLSERPTPQHHKWDCINRLGATHIAILREENEARRLAIEDDLCKTYDPPCNG